MMTAAHASEDIRSSVIRIIFFCHLYMNAVAYNWTCMESESALMDRTCYTFNEVPLAWEDARKACVDKDSVIASVFSEEDIREILSQLPNAHMRSSSFSAWVGANDIPHEGTFVWMVDNGTVIEDVWKGDLPSNTEDKDCAAIDSTMRLGVEPCSEHKPSLCMYLLRGPDIKKFKELFPCRCSDMVCDSNGDCPNTGKCLIGHFGTGCQYRNLHSNLHGKYKSINDYDSTTCLTNISQPLHIKFPHRHYFTWIRIVVEELSIENPFTLAFPFNNSYKDCENQKFVSLDGFTFDMWCKGGPHVVDDFQISWDDNVSVCQIYFNGGRNMAFYVTEVSHCVFTNNYDAAYDEIKGRGSKFMTAVYTFTTSAYLNLLFKKEINIREQILYLEIRYNYSHIEGSYFGALNKWKHIFHYTHGPDEKNPVMWYRPDNGSKVDSVRILALKFPVNGTKRRMDVQEFESYGGCPSDVHGLACKEPCHKNCDWQGCLETNGICYRCKDGTELRICVDPPTESTVVTSTPANTTETPENVTLPVTNEDGSMGGGMSRVTGTWRPLPPMSTVVAHKPNSENLWEYIVYGLVSAATVLAVVPLLCLCHARCMKPVGEAEAQGDAGNTTADGFSETDRKLTPSELMALSRGTKSKASGLSKSTTSRASGTSQGSRRSHETTSYYSEAITENTNQTQSTLIF